MENTLTEFRTICYAIQYGRNDGKRQSENMREARISFYGPTQNSLNFFRFAALPPSILFADRPTYSCLLKLNRK